MPDKIKQEVRHRAHDTRTSKTRWWLPEDEAYGHFNMATHLDAVTNDAKTQIAGLRGVDHDEIEIILVDMDEQEELAGEPGEFEDMMVPNPDDDIVHLDLT